MEGGVNFGRRSPPMGGQYSTPINRFTAELTFSRDRNVIGISGGIEDQDDQVSDNDEEHEFAGVFWQRQLNRHSSVG